MARFHFHLHEHGVCTRDDEGAEHVDLDAARAVAIATAREIMCEGLKTGALSLDCYIDIADDNAQVLTRVEFADAVTVADDS